MTNENSVSKALPDLCAICGSEAPTQTFEQKVKIAKPPRNAYGERLYESLSLPVCDQCLKKHQRLCLFLQVIYSVTVILGALLGFYTLYQLGNLPNLVVLAPYAYGVGGLFFVTLVAYYWERNLDRRYVKREKTGVLSFRQPAFTLVYNTQERSSAEN